MVDENLAIKYYGLPPYFRNIYTGIVENLPFRVRLPDGSTRTDPEEWSLDDYVLYSAGYEETEITQEDIDRKLPTLDNLKQEKLQILESYWNSKINSGFTTPQGWKLGLSINDVTLLTGAFLLLKEATNLGLANSTDIIDMENNSHSLDLQTMTSLMLAYGQYRSQLSSEYSTFKNQILAANNKMELDNIVIGE
jgi:hypothetical protein